MKSVQAHIESKLKEAVKSIAEQDASVHIEHSSNLVHGDYTSNIALAMFSSSKFKIQNSKFKNPLELGQYLKGQLSKQKLDFIDRIEVAPPGFINFHISKKFLSNLILQLLEQDDKVTLSTKMRGKKIVLEFTDPNPFKEFHIGHLRNIILGESYARLLEAQGAKVWRVNYQGDVGLHVAKALFGIKKHESRIKDLEKVSIEEKLRFLGEAYALGAQAYEKNESAKKEIAEINKMVYQISSVTLERSDKVSSRDSIGSTQSTLQNDIRLFYQKGRQWSLEGFEEIYQRVGTKFEHYYFESQTSDPGLVIVKEHIKDGVFEESDGAIVYKGEKEGLHTRVFVTKEGYPTYEGKDMALPSLKYQDFAYDESIILTAHEQQSYFKVVLAAIREVFPELGKKTKHYSFGFVSLKEGKMSSRSGNIITGMWLLDEAKRRIQKEFKDMDSKTLETVAVGAVKYSMLKFAPVSDIAFSFQESISLEGNSGPYLQYTYARTQSVLTKVQSSKFKVQSQVQNVKFNEEELMLMRLIFRFDEVVEKAGDEFAPNLLANYLYELAQKFNHFYQKHKILESDNQEFRLALTSVVGKVLKEGLQLLGIKAPEKM